ncbi:unnamed protein product [Lasius platythorax]|uniref:Uncharacterized protein n=1 Tax=Lasius platythorax TaxID=488582 RepID=A0AAV2NT72_9HYME
MGDMRDGHEESNRTTSPSNRPTLRCSSGYAELMASIVFGFSLDVQFTIKCCSPNFLSPFNLTYFYA